MLCCVKILSKIKISIANANAYQKDLLFITRFFYKRPEQEKLQRLDTLSQLIKSISKRFDDKNKSSCANSSSLMNHIADYATSCSKEYKSKLQDLIMHLVKDGWYIEPKLTEMDEKKIDGVFSDFADILRGNFSLDFVNESAF